MSNRIPSSAADAMHIFSYRRTGRLSVIFGVEPRQMERWSAEHDHQAGPIDKLEVAAAAVYHETGDLAVASAPARYLLSQLHALADAREPAALPVNIAAAARDFSKVIDCALSTMADGRMTRDEHIALTREIAALQSRLDELRRSAQKARFATVEARS